jgi:cyclase
MLRKRIIFTLIYSDGFFNQSRNFRLQRVGDINWLEENYGFQDISFALDELIILNASRNNKDVVSFSKILSRIAKNVFIPISSGGGVKCEKDASILFDNGADKIVLNTSCYNNPNLIESLTKKYGSQSVVASVDYKNEDVFIEDGTNKINIKLYKYIEYLQDLGVGEIYLNSIDKDGTGFGCDIAVANKVSNLARIPVIIAGGAGNESHLMEVLAIDKVGAVATANLFNFIGNGLKESRDSMIRKKYNLSKFLSLNQLEL